MNIYSKKNIIVATFLAAALLGLLLWSGVYSTKRIIGKQEPAVELMLDWYKHALDAERFSEGFRPPVAARMYAYMGLAGWEAARPVIGGGFLSLAPRYPALKLPLPDTTVRYHLPTVLNACYSYFLQKMFITAPRTIEQKRNVLEAKWSAYAMNGIDSASFTASFEFGKQVAFAVYEWSATDSIGHQANLHLYDKDYALLNGESFWQPCEDFPMPPMLPHWGEARTFAIKTEDHMAAPLPVFSMEPQSPYYVQALEVFTMNSPLSPENQWIAEFWSDDFPGLTYSSTGRWISISNQVIEKEHPSVEKALETYLRVGFSISDAAVACWKSKYHYNLLRPETFIRHTIQPDWRPIVHTPSFPSYPSGHAMFSAAAAEVLTQLYGKKIELTDRSHEGRTEFKGTPRHYHSFYEMAFENASSRIALGVHYRMDCDEGTRLGLNIGKEVAAIKVAKLEQ